MERILFDPGFPSSRFYDVAEDVTFVWKDLSAAENLTLLLLVTRLRYIAGEIKPERDDIRVIQMPCTVLLEDGHVLAPLVVYFRMSDDGWTALVMEISSRESQAIVLNPIGVVEMLNEEHETLRRARSF